MEKRQKVYLQSQHRRYQDVHAKYHNSDGVLPEFEGHHNHNVVKGIHNQEFREVGCEGLQLEAYRREEKPKPQGTHEHDDDHDHTATLTPT